MSTFLVELINDIIEHPDDAAYDRLLSVSSSEPVAPATQANPPTEAFDVFLSYSSLDKDEAREIDSAVRQKSKTCFLAEKTLKPGDLFKDKIRDALTGSRQVWILVSPKSIKSDWVQREVAAAWALKKRIVPILLRCSSADLPEILSDTHAIDFHKVASLISELASS